MTREQTFACNGERFPATRLFTLETQQQIAQAREHGAQIVCLCTDPGTPMVSRKYGGRIFLARWPDTGHRHDPECPSFDLSSRPDAVREQEDGTVEIRASFALGAQPQDPPPASAAASATKRGMNVAPPVQHAPALGLSDVLHQLWRLSDLDRWFPAMAGRRHWGVVGYHLAQAAQPVLIGGKELVQHLFVPQPYRGDVSQADGQLQTLRDLCTANGSALLLAPLREIAASKFGFKIGFSHLPQMMAYASSSFAVAPALARLRENDRLICLARVTSRRHYFQIDDLGFIPVTSSWLPYIDLTGARVLDDLVAKGERFLVLHGHQAPDSRVAVLLRRGETQHVVVADTSTAGWRVEQFHSTTGSNAT